MLRYDYWVDMAVLGLPFIFPSFKYAFRALALYTHGHEAENLS